MVLLAQASDLPDGGADVRGQDPGEDVELADEIATELFLIDDIGGLVDALVADELDVGPGHRRRWVKTDDEQAEHTRLA